jgi:hypothetical protein
MADRKIPVVGLSFTSARPSVRKDHPTPPGYIELNLNALRDSRLRKIVPLLALYNTLQCIRISNVVGAKRLTRTSSARHDRLDMRCTARNEVGGERVRAAATGRG